MIWELREGIAGAACKLGYTLHYDVSLSSDHYYDIVNRTRTFIADSPDFTVKEKQAIETCGYGHVGDGNLHLNITLPGYEDKVL